MADTADSEHRRGCPPRPPRSATVIAQRAGRPRVGHRTLADRSPETGSPSAKWTHQRGQTLPRKTTHVRPTDASRQTAGSDSRRRAGLLGARRRRGAAAVRTSVRTCRVAAPRRSGRRVCRHLSQPKSAHLRVKLASYFRRRGYRPGARGSRGEVDRPQARRRVTSISRCLWAYWAAVQFPGGSALERTLCRGRAVKPLWRVESNGESTYRRDGAVSAPVLSANDTVRPLAILLA